MARKRAERQIVIEAAPQACFDALLEYESFPQWQRAVRSCKVLSRDRSGRGKDVAFEIHGKVRPIRYTLHYRYEPPHLITWSYSGGDVKDLDGELVLEDRGDGTTLATYALRLDAGTWLPGQVAGAFSDQAMQRAMEDLKRRAEGRPGT
jgi:ribosome-associated toxin RatA of RatAB toxin-antitoxin module